ncbi:MAG: DUF5615 family PIN-like protein [Bacteroidota bacterium]|nr:DUF5615 family PIN-like protein [Bacteroidota bacterium]
MKLLFDQNISFRVLSQIESQYPIAKQVRMLGLYNLKDKEIWEYAKKHRYIIVTFDGDFYELSNYYGHPPKIIWLRMGNMSTEKIAELLIYRFSLIEEFI